MQNLVPLGNGNSRFMKSSISSNTTLAQLIQMLNNGTFPYDVGPINPAGVTQQGTPLNKTTLLQDATAALYGLGADAVPDNLFNVLSKSALYKTVAATQQLGSLTEGSIIYLNENGSLVPFYVAKQNYEPDYNTNRTLVVRKDAVMQGQWNSSGVNTYDGSTIDTWFNSTYLNTLDSDVKTAIGTTNIPATSPYNSGVIRLEKGVFALSATELNQTSSKINTEGTVIPIAYTILGITSTGSLWTRSPGNSSTNAAIAIVTSGTGDTQTVTNSYKYLPAFTLPSTFTAYIEEPTTGLYDVLDNLIMPLPAAQIVTGSYVGTGTNGSENFTSVTLSSIPKLLIIECDYSVRNIFSNTFPTTHVGIFVPGASTGMSFYTANNNQPSFSNMYGYSLTLKTEGTTVSWSTDNNNGDAKAQLNASNKTYRYVAFL